MEFCPDLVLLGQGQQCLSAPMGYLDIREMGVGSVVLLRAFVGCVFFLGNNKRTPDFVLLFPPGTLLALAFLVRYDST